MRLVMRNGGQLPLWFEDILNYSSIATVAFDPLAAYQASAMADSNLSTMNKYLENGFGVKNATDSSGYIYAITWSQYDAYVKAHKGTLPANYTFAGIIPRQIHLAAGEWCVTPLVKVFAENDNSYASTIATINVGRIL